MEKQTTEPKDEMEIHRAANESVRRVNDHLRKSIWGLLGFKDYKINNIDPGEPVSVRYIFTESVQDLAQNNYKKFQEVITAVEGYNSFSEDDNPYNEHDMGFFEVDGTKYMFKIDYYDDSWEFFKPNGNRAFTILEASEY